MDNIVINLDKTPEKFRSYAEQIIEDFVKLFRDYTKITEPYMKRLNELFEQNKGVIRTAENWHDFDDYYAEMDKLKDDCKRDKLELLSGHITDNIYISSGDMYPSRFSYFNSGCTIYFIMKSEKKITLDTVFTNEGYERHRFVLRKDNNVWKLDWIGLSYEEEGYERKADFL